MKHSLECLIKVLKVLIILREIQSKRLPNFIMIKITYQTSFTGVVSFVFSHEVLTNSRKGFPLRKTVSSSVKNYDNFSRAL